MTDSQPELPQLIALLGEAGSRDTVPTKLHQFGESAVEPLVAALQAEDENLRVGVAWVIGRVKDSVLGEALKTSALQPLIECLLHDESGRGRLQALNTLVLLANDSNRSDLIGPFMAALQDSQEGVRAEAVRWLGQHQVTEAAEVLRQLMQQDPSERVRGRAAYALAYIEPDLSSLRAAGEAGIEALTAAVKDPERSVRLRAIWALGMLRNSASVRLLASVLDGNGHFQEKRMAAEALGQLGDGSAAEALIMALQFDSHEGVRSSAAEALGILGDQRALSMLIRSLLNDAQPSVRASAARALEIMGDASAVEPLIEALEDIRPEVRFEAARALGTLGDPRAVEALNALANEAQASRHIREAAAKAVETINRH